jgi:hypothetical protein
VKSAPIVDVIIPIHDSNRPLERTIRSLLTTGLSVGSEVLVTVVCHNVAIAEISSKLPSQLRELVNFLELHDGLPNPGGPRTHGLEQTNSQYISFLDSDDTFDPQALKVWVALAEAHSLDAVIPPERHDTGKAIRTPPVRRFRAGNLDPVRDRVSYRTAPLGLIRRAAIERLGLEFGTGVRTGEDQAFALKLWFGSNSVRFARGAPSYIVGGDAQARVTTQLQLLADELKSPRDLIRSTWFAEQSVASKSAIAVKLVRLQLFGGVERRLTGNVWAAESHAAAAEFLDTIKLVASGYQNSLSVADVRLCHAIANQTSTVTKLSLLANKRRAFGRPATLLTADLRHLLLPDAPLRYMIATALH